MGTLVLFSALFFALHRLISGSGLRDRIVAVVGEAPFRRVFALVSFLCLAGLWIGYRHAVDSPLNMIIFQPPGSAKFVQMPMQLIAVFLIVAGVTTRNPTIAGLGSAVSEASIIRGILRITRHPFLWGVTLFAAGHMLATPTVASWGFFGTLLVLAISGTISIDAKRSRALGADWKAFASATSNVPFVAIIQGRQSLEFAEVGLTRVIAAAIGFALLLAVHGVLFSVSPFP